MKYVRYSREVINANPKRISVALDMAGKGVCLSFEPFLNMIGNGFYLGVGVAFANDEVVSWGIIQFSHVELDDVFALDVLNTFNDQFVQRLGGEFALLNFGV